MEAAGGDVVVVPVLLLDPGLDRRAVTQPGHGLDLELAPITNQFDLQAPIGQDAPVGFAVENARVSIPRLEIGLVAADPPAVVFSALLETPVLDSRVATDDLVLQLQFEVGRLAPLPDDERVAIGRVCLGRLTGDRPVLGSRMWWSVRSSPNVCM